MRAKLTLAVAAALLIAPAAGAAPCLFPPGKNPYVAQWIHHSVRTYRVTCRDTSPRWRQDSNGSTWSLIGFKHVICHVKLPPNSPADPVITFTSYSTPDGLCTAKVD